MDDRVGPLWVAEQRDQVRDPVQGGLDGVLGAAGQDLPFRLAQLLAEAQAVRSGQPSPRASKSWSRPLIRSMSAVAAASRSRVLATTSGGALARNESLASLR